MVERSEEGEEKKKTVRMGGKEEKKEREGMGEV